MTPSTILLYGMAAAALDPSVAPPALAPVAVVEGQAKAREQDEAPNEVDSLTVEAERRGKVDTPIEPDFVMDEEAIQSLGASNLLDAINILAPQLQGTRGRDSGPPVMLVNGRRISGMQEMQGIPPEAIQRFEIYPEEVALSQGYKADQRVLNIILKKNFNSKMVEGLARIATDGGRTISTLQGNRLNINGDKRWNVDVSFQHQPKLLETDRDIVRSPGGQPFDLTGNIGGGAEIDPALSALAGSTVTFAGVPTSAAAGRAALADFAGLAGRYNTGDLTAARGLLPQSEKLTLRGARTGSLGKQTLLTLSGNLEDTHTEMLLGLPGVTFSLPAGSPFSPFSNAVTGYRFINAPSALARESDTLRTQLAMAANGRLGSWRWAANGDFDRIVSDTTTGRGFNASAFQAAVAAGDPTVNPFGVISPSLYKAMAPDTAHSVSTSASADLLLNGTLVEAPAGPIQSSFKLGVDTRELDSKTMRSGVTTTRGVSRDRQSVQGNVTVPLTSARRSFLAKVGDLSASANFEYEELSDLGGLTTLGGSLNWTTPVKGVSFLASYTDEQGAPSTNQINDPILVTPNIVVFDFSTGQSALISRTTGGNANLRNDNRTVSTFSATYKPFEQIDLSLRATYTRAQTKNMIASFPEITPDLERAFPERFTRDAAGRLLAIDARPVNFASAENENIRWGLNLFKVVGKPTAAAPGRPGGPPSGPPGGPGGSPGGGGVMRFGPPPGAQGGGAGPGGGPGGGGPGGPGGPGPSVMPKPGQGMIQLSIYHTWRLSDEITIRKGLPTLDQLDGAAISARNGQARHEVQANGGYTRNGMGVRFNATWRGSTWVNGGAAGGQTLYFSDLATAGVMSFANLNTSHKALVAKYPWLKNGNVSLNFENIFNAKQTVRDQSGNTPQAYQRDYLDPLGRTVRIGFRKLIY